MTDITSIYPVTPMNYFASKELENVLNAIFNKVYTPIIKSEFCTDEIGIQKRVISTVAHEVCWDLQDYLRQHELDKYLAGYFGNTVNDHWQYIKLVIRPECYENLDNIKTVLKLKDYEA